MPDVLIGRQRARQRTSWERARGYHAPDRRVDAPSLKSTWAAPSYDPLRNVIANPARTYTYLPAADLFNWRAHHKANGG